MRELFHIISGSHDPPEKTIAAGIKMLPAGLLCNCGCDLQLKVWLLQQVALTDTMLPVPDFSISHKEPQVLQLIKSERLVFFCFHWCQNYWLTQVYWYFNLLIKACTLFFKAFTTAI